MAFTATNDVPIVGRTGELELMFKALVEGERPTFVVAGPAGVGKTRLASEAAKLAESVGYSTTRVMATAAASTIPFAAFAPLLPEMDQAHEDLTGFLHSAGEALLERAEPGKRLLLVVDDAQLLDNGSATLVHQLVQRGLGALVASVRTPSKVPDPITSLWKEGLAERIDLGPLTEREVSVLAGGVLDGPVEGPTLRWLFGKSKGNPLFVRELLRGAASGGSLRRDSGGVWSVHLPWNAPDRLVELVAVRLDGLAPPAVATVELLALGEPLGYDVLSQLASPESIEDAERAAMVVVRHEGRRVVAALAHPLYGDVLRQRLGGARRRRLCRDLAEAFAALGMHRRDDALQVAQWQLDAGIRGDPELLARAVARARETFDYELLKRLAPAALEAGAGVATAVRLAEAFFSTGEHAAADELLDGLMSRCTSDDERGQVGQARLYSEASMTEDLARVEAVAAEAVALIAEPGPRMRLFAQLATVRVAAGDIRGGLALAEELLAGPDLPPRRMARFPATLALALLGRTGEAIEAAYSAHAASEGLGGGAVPGRELIPAIFALTAAGRVSEAEAEAARVYDSAIGHSHNFAADIGMYRGLVQVEAGRLEDASLSFRTAAAGHRELGDPTLRASLGGVALAEGMAGRAATAEAACGELDQVTSSLVANFLDLDFVERGRAWARVAAGDLSGARRILRSAAGAAAEAGQAPGEARLLHDLVRLDEPRAAAERLRALAEAIGGTLVPAFADHAAARLRRDGAAIFAVAERFEHTGALLVAAEAFDAAGVLLAEDGLARLSSAATVRAAGLRVELGIGDGAAAPPSRAAARLTKREKEIAQLAASGATSRAIAERLFVSARTVENHIQHIYTKLGVTNRDELATALA